MDAAAVKTGRYKILIVEDDQTNAMLLTQMLEAARGHFVVWTRNGPLALKAVCDESFDVILMDIHMPEMSGFESSRQIRQLGYEVPIIALTSDATCIENEEIKSSGINFTVLKPFRFKQLEAVIESAVGLT